MNSYFCTMDRRIIPTSDGTPTLYVPGLGEHYHSIHGARRESEHIFIESALDYFPGDPVRVLEFGFGTGLNALLTLRRAKETGRQIFYHALEKYPLEAGEVEEVCSYFRDLHFEWADLERIHSVPWGRQTVIDPYFSILKEQVDFRETTISGGPYNVIYFDAFAPAVQPDLWSEEVFRKIHSATAPGGVLTTYSVKGSVRRNLQSAGFTVKKIEGPPGKREITRATKDSVE